MSTTNNDAPAETNVPRLCVGMTKRRQQSLWPQTVKNLVRFQAHVRGVLQRIEFDNELCCEMQDILESQDPDLEEYYDILARLYSRVYSNY